MIDILIITSEILTPADAASVSRAEAAVSVLPEEDFGLRTSASGSPEAMAACPKIIAEDTALELFGSEEDKLLLSIWEKRRAEEFMDLPVRKASLWNDEYDRLLEPVKQAAETYGRIMTPAVYINGELLSSGRAVKPCELEKCLKEMTEN